MAEPFAWLGRIEASAQVLALVEAVRAVGVGGRDGGAVRPVSAAGGRGSSTAILAGALHRALGRPVLLVVAHLDEADDALDDLELFGASGSAIDAARFGALEVLPGESSVSLDLLAERLGVVERVRGGAVPGVVVAPVQALMQGVPCASAMRKFAVALRPGDAMPMEELVAWLGGNGYERQDAIEQPGDFAVRGGLVDVFLPTADGPVRLDFFGDELDAVHRIDADTMGSKAALDEVRLIGADASAVQGDADALNVVELLPRDTVVVLHEPMELSEQARGYYERLTTPGGVFSPNQVFHRLGALAHVEVNVYSGAAARGETVVLPVSPLPSFETDAAQAVAELGELAGDGASEVVVVCQKEAEAHRLRELLGEFAPAHGARVGVEVAWLHRGFVWGDGGSGRVAEWPSGQDRSQAGAGAGSELGHSATRPLGHSCLYLVPHHELFHRYETRRRVRQVTADAATMRASDAFLDLEPGDHVVHVDHGIARFDALKTIKRDGQSQEFLRLVFADDAVVNVPATQIDLIQKYVGGFEDRPPLSKLGGKSWRTQKDRVAEAVKDLAKQLLQVHAARMTQPGIVYPADTLWQTEFEAEFPYQETEDQLAAIAATKRDMQQDRPMDRLVCGDVGFGKTEVAIRAAFKACEYGKQVAVLVPTTVLAEQHGKTFRQRMADYPFKVASLSRFRTGKEIKATLKELAAGRIDIVIGTHRLLSKDVRFADLGLVVIDEEQRFGVEHKNKLLELRLTADVMTLTATPIPRTLHMSMVGLRDISSLTQAPVDRRAIVTEVVPYEKGRVKQAILRELARDGQCYFVHNRVYNIQSVADDLRQLVPDARIVIGHGQMPTRELERVMLAFTRREADILVSTTIIESGIDIPTANTMFINQADHFGLAELHQLRGRVGRYKHRAYCYLLLPEDRTVNEVATKRLRAIEGYSMLGAGFKIAMRDLEIRGAGNLLGSEQSGHIAAVGYEMYCLLLEQETKRLKQEAIIEPCRTHLELPITGGLPKRYVKSDKHRMDLYRRLSRAATPGELAGVVKAMGEAYGDPPAVAKRLIDLTELRIGASLRGVDKVQLEGADLVFTVRKAGPVAAVFEGAPGRATVIDERTVYWRPPANYLEPADTLLAVLRKLLVRPGR